MDKIIEKAVKGGFPRDVADEFIGLIGFDSDNKELDNIKNMAAEHLILNHDFLRAFFGEDVVHSECGNDLDARSLYDEEGI